MGQVGRLMVRNAAPLIFLAVILLAAVSCASPRGSFCAVSEPIRLSSQAIDAMSDDEVKDVLAHNRLGQRLCGWRP